MSVLKKLAGQTIIYGLSTILGRALNYLLVPFYTYMIFKPAEYGVVADLYAYVGFLNILYIYRMETAFFRDAPESADSKYIAYSTASTSVLVSTIFFTVLLVLCSPSIANYLEYPDKPYYIRWFAFIIGFDTLCALPFALLRQEGKAFRFALIRLTNILLNLSLNSWFLWICPYLWKQGYTWIAPFYRTDWGVEYVFIANLVASAISFLLLLPTLYFSDSEGKKHLAYFGKYAQTIHWKRMLLYALPLVLAGFAGMINEVLDRQLLKRFLDGDLSYRLGQIGIYAANYKLAMIVTLMTSAFTYAAEPFFFNQAKEKGATLMYAKVTQAFVLASVLAFLFIMLYIDIFQYFVGTAYREGLKIVPILLIANIFLGLYYNLSFWFKLTNRNLMGTYIAFLGAATTILLNILFIPLYGYIASAWATLVCYAVMAGLSYILGQRYYPIPYRLSHIGFYIFLALAVFFLNDYVRTFVHDFWQRIVWATCFLLLYLGAIAYLEKDEYKKSRGK